MNPQTEASEIIEMINDISKIEGECLLDKIVAYCEKNSLDPQDVGDILAESEQFKRKLHINLVETNVIKDPGFQRRNKLCEDIDEW